MQPAPCAERWTPVIKRADSLAGWYNSMRVKEWSSDDDEDDENLPEGDARL